jgi:peptidoglycan/LPS O-acetylase OafA/YrhL
MLLPVQREPFPQVSGGPAPMQNVKFDNLTFARFIAALLIVFHHSPTVLQDAALVPPAWLRLFFKNGYVGVTFFFILSGFVIAASSFERLRTPSLRATGLFYARRVIRIVPVWLFLSLPFILPPLFAWPIPSSLVQFLTFTQAWSSDVHVAFGYLAVAWTLSCEMFFYALFPLAAIIMGRLQDRYRHAGATLILVAILVPLGGYLLFAFDPTMAAFGYMDPNGPHRWLYRNPALRFAEFLLGIGLYLCFQQYYEYLRKARFLWIWLAVLMASLGVVAAVMFNFPIGAPTLTLAYIVPFGLIVFALAALQVNEKPVAIRWPALLLLGEASYSLYLVHQQFGLLNYMAPFESGVSLRNLAVAIALTVMVSIGLYKLIEQPARSALNRRLARFERSPRSAE